MMKLLPMVVVFEVPFEPVKVTIGVRNSYMPAEQILRTGGFR